MLVVLVLIGVSRPFLARMGVASQDLTALSLSPMTHVFSSHHFFSKIHFFFEYDDRQDEVMWKELFNFSDGGVNIYTGKMRYNLFFMESALGDEQALALARYFFCSKNGKPSLFSDRQPPRSVRVLYESHFDGKVLKDVRYSCP